ncbi:MAG: DUF4185 domain-containing protein [Saprospiraceae bacterium]|nr:DUF4185 domain-containing protein [Saprospiraceae bacterium]
MRIVLLIGCLTLFSCVSKKSIKSVGSDDNPLKFHVEAAPEWTDLFYRKSGWFGADGIFSIPLDGIDKNSGQEETLLIFSDTYIGEVQDNKPLPGHSMVNNTIAYFHGTDPKKENIQFHYNKDSTGKPTSFFKPIISSTGHDQYFWLGDGFINKELDNQLFIFAYHVEKTGPNVFDFIDPAVSLLALPEGSRPPYLFQRQIETPLHLSLPFGEGNLGSGILVNTKWAGVPDADGFIYVYGCIGSDKNLVVARVKPKHFEDFSRWRYWTSEGWSKNQSLIIPITDAASNELSVTPLPDGRYLLVFQVLGLSDKVGIRIGDSPIGPFSEIQEIWHTPEYEEGLLPYNAKAHPALSKPGELLISYNTITFDFWNDIQQNAHIYRPRFIKMIFD